MPQHVFPLVVQNGEALVVQHFLLAPHLVLPQQVCPAATQNGDEPVVQQMGLFAGHGGEQVCALRDDGAQAATKPPNIAPPMRRMTPRRDVGFASSRARLSIS